MEPHNLSLSQQPSTSSEESREYVIIKYPGLVKNVQKAIDSLGGDKLINMQVTKNVLVYRRMVLTLYRLVYDFAKLIIFLFQLLYLAHSSHRPLELRYHPENPYANPLISERQTVEKYSGNGTVYAVLKVRRNKRRPSVVEAKITGIVSTLYSFTSMCDFQYLPLQKISTKEETWLDTKDLIPNGLTNALSWWENNAVEEIPLFLPPYQFSRYNTPSNKILCRETDFSLEKVKQRNAGHGQSLRCERKALSVTVHGNDVFPTAPSEEAILHNISLCKHQEPHKLLEDLFKERPMWTRIGIASKTGLEETLIQKFAFYILNGPWGRLWCRFGYDPRADPSSKIYQTVMVTFRQHTKIPERQRLKVVKMGSERALPISVTGNAFSGTAQTHCGTNLDGPSIDYWYSPVPKAESLFHGISDTLPLEQLPQVRQMWYCLCDVRLPIAEQILKRNCFVQGNRADEQNGWLPPEAIEQVREAIKENVKKITDQLEEDRGSDAGNDTLDEDWTEF
uniref:General transcription factor 3C polypeptide 5 n=1 Tax=Syphacia muris TaxID=451379 RepID=A0A0N5AVS2_9BILA